MKPRILIVEDEPDALELIGYNVREAGMNPVFASNGTQALEVARTTRPELIVLDLILPELDGLEVCKLLQRDPHTQSIPIVMLSGRTSEMDRVVGLELGASDYLTKPFSPRELMLRIRKLLLRDRPETERFTGLQLPGFELNVLLRAVWVDGQTVKLTPIEFDLLVALARHRGEIQSRATLLQDVFGYEEAARSRTVDTHLNRLLKKLGPASRYIGSIRGLGYRFEAEL